MLIADAATILCLFFGLLSVLIIFLSFSGLSQTPDPFLNPTTQSKSSFSAVETILFPTAVIHASLKHGMFSFSDDHFVYNGRSGIWWTFFSQCSIWHNMVPKLQKKRNVSPFLAQIRYTLSCTNVIRGWMCVKARQRRCTKNIGNEFTFKRSHLLW